MDNEIIEAMRIALDGALGESVVVYHGTDDVDAAMQAALRAALETALAAEDADHPWNKLWNAAYRDNQ